MTDPTKQEAELSFALQASFLKPLAAKLEALNFIPAVVAELFEVVEIQERRIARLEEKLAARPEARTPRSVFDQIRNPNCK